MAKLTSAIKFIGPLGDITGVKRHDSPDYYLKYKSGPSSATQNPRTDPGSKFGKSMEAAKVQDYCNTKHTPGHGLW